VTTFLTVAGGWIVLSYLINLYYLVLKEKLPAKRNRSGREFIKYMLVFSPVTVLIVLAARFTK
jgi:hypothetical protein